MLRFVVTICALSHLATALPQRSIQLGGGPPRPVAYGPTATPSASPFSPSFSQQLSFGPPSGQLQPSNGAAAPQIRARNPNTYQSPQPIIISQSNPSASPATPGAQFASFPGGFGGAGRQILTLRSPAHSADEDEYEYEDDDEPQRQSPSPRPVQPTRSPVRVQSPSPGFGAVPGRFPVQQQPQQQSNRQRQPIQQGIPVASAPQQQRGQQHQQSAPRPGGQFGIDGKRSRLTTPPPVQTVNRFMKQNEDGSMTWGYENEDGTFKEETLGADCVVRGKYGYIDPEGNKREYEYQTGNPCDPNKKDQEEELEEDDDLPDGPSRQQQIAGVLNARPRPVQRRPVGGGGQIPQYQAQPQYQIS